MFFLVGKYCTLIEDIFTPITETNCTFHHTFILSKAVELAPNDFAKAFCPFHDVLNFSLRPLDRQKPFPVFFLSIYFNSHNMFRHSGPVHMLLHTLIILDIALFTFNETMTLKVTLSMFWFCSPLTLYCNLC